MKKEEVETVNKADNLIYQTEKSMKDLGDKLSDEEKEKVNSKKDELKKALESNNIEDIKTKTDELTEEFNKIAEKIYQQEAQSQTGQQPGGQQEQEQEQSSDDDDVVDADYEVVDEDEEKDE